MSDSKFQRLERLVGADALRRLHQTKVILFGVGGVGSWAAESLIRSGIGELIMVDVDDVDITNINRQMPATTQTIGRIKTEVVADRLRQINPDAKILWRNEYYTADSASSFNLDHYDYVLDAIDTLSDKALLIRRATQSKATLFSSMGAAMKMDSTRISVAEFWKVEGCPLAAALRRKFRKEGEFPARKFKCVYSPELFANRGEDIQQEENGGSSFDWSRKKPTVNGTVCHTTAIFGFTLAGLVVEDVVGNQSLGD